MNEREGADSIGRQNRGGFFGGRAACVQQVGHMKASLREGEKEAEREK